MSYDVTLYIDTGAGNYICCFDSNMTSNVAPMWREAGADLAKMHELPAWRAVDVLTAAIDNMTNYPQDYRAMEPANGWGDYDGCLEFLTSIRDACRKHPRAYISISR